MDGTLLLRMEDIDTGALHAGIRAGASLTISSWLGD
jgi:hypothetical protein